MKTVESLRTTLQSNPRRTAIIKILPRLLAANSKPSDGVKPFLNILESLVLKHGGGDPALKEEILTFFSSYKDRYYLSGEKTDDAAVIIAEALNEADENIAWAVGAVEPAGLQRIGLLKALKEVLPKEKIDALVRACIAEVTTCCENERVIKPLRDYGGKVTKSSFIQKNSLQMYWNLAYREMHLIHHDLFSSLGVMLEFLAHTHRGSPDSLIRAWGHPAVQARFGTEYGQVARKRDATESFAWITASASDVTIAIGIVESLQTIMRLEVEARELNSSGQVQFPWTSLDVAKVDIKTTKATLLQSLADKLERLSPPANLRWIGFLLSEIEYILPRAHDKELSDDHIAAQEALEGAAANALMASKSQINEGISALTEGLKTPPRRTTAFHLFDIGQLLKPKDQGANAALLMALLDDYQAQLQSNMTFHVNFDIHGRAWTERLARAIGKLHVQGKMNLTHWFQDLVKDLPVSLWDFDEDPSRFILEQGRTKHLLLTASLGLRNIACHQNVEDIADVVLNSLFSFWTTLVENPLLQNAEDLEILISEAAALILEVRPARTREYADYLKKSVRAGRSGGLRILMESKDVKARDLIERIMRDAFDMDLQAESMDLHWWIECWRKLGKYELGVKALNILELKKDPMHNQRDTYFSYLEWLAKKNIDGHGLSHEERQIAGRMHAALWGHIRIPSEDSRRQSLERMLPGINIR